MRGSPKPIRVAIVGGGCASLTAAYELTRPEQKGRYEVTVYQLGWRLGGKGASGRGVANRIEEHGLHLWMGFYENAFRLMRDCYAALPTRRAKRRFAVWSDAFEPAHDVGVADRKGNGDWEFWLAHFDSGDGRSAGGFGDGASYTVLGYLRQAASLVTELIRSAGISDGSASKPSRGRARSPKRGDPEPPQRESVESAVETVLRYGELATLAAAFEASDVLRQAVEMWMPRELRGGMELQLRLIDSLAAATRRQLQQRVANDARARRVWEVVDIILAILRGATLNGMALDPRGFDSINDYDWREWLRMNGASPQSLDSGFMRGIYDLVFAYEDGDVTRPRLAAGVALRGAMRMFFTYRGALFWRMNAGMGDVVFAPLYEVLRQRGVRFEFFHRLRNVGLAPPEDGEAPHVDRLEFDVQALVRGGHEYQPLVEVGGVPSWPAVPLHRQLVDGARIARNGGRGGGRDFEAFSDQRRAAVKTLRVTEDFDFVVLGVSIGAIPHVAPELIARSSKWRDMVSHVKTVPTQAFQIWLNQSVEALGWARPGVSVSGFVEPFDTWADMQHLIPRESWGGAVKSIAYFCSVLPDESPEGGVVTDVFHERQRKLVRQHAIEFLERDVGAFWPRSAENGTGFRWSLLVAEKGTKNNGRRPRGQRRFDTQFWTANVNPSDRYVLSLPGSLQYRLSPLDLTFDNLTIAGDWTATGLDTGCIESAVMSGMLAAHALSQYPALKDIVGYDHP